MGSVSRPYLRFPAIAGDLLAFVADDDIWLAELRDKTTARRLSAGCGPIIAPHFSPSASTVAFTGRRDGPAEAYVLEAQGGEVRRLTYLADETTRVIGFEDDATVLVVSAAGQPFSTRTMARAVPVDGGPARELGLGPITALARHGDGTVVVGVNQSLHRGASWKRYRGGSAARLWVKAGGAETFVPMLRELSGQVEDPVFVGDRLCFLSDHEGVANLYSVRSDGSDLRRHSDHDPFYARALRSDGERLIYQCAGDLWLVDDLSARGSPRRLEVRLGGALVGRSPQRIQAKDHLGAFSFDDTGTSALLEVRGTIQLLAYHRGPTRLLGGGNGVRARLPAVLGSGASAEAVFVSDAEGPDALELVGLGRAGHGRVRRLGSGRIGRVLELATSPDGARVVLSTHDGRVLALELATGAVEELDASSEGEVTGLAFSPDSRLCAWSHPGPDPLRQIRIANLEHHEVIEATPLRFRDEEPVFSRDGRYLAFLSSRTFDPVYDAQVFDLSFPFATRPYLLVLSAQTPSPFDPAPEGEAGPPEREKAEVPFTRVDVDGLDGRVVAVPVAPGRYQRLRSIVGGVSYLSETLRGELGEARSAGDEAMTRSLMGFDLTSRRERLIASGVGAYEVSRDGKRILAALGTDLRVLAVEGHDDEDAASEERGEIDLSRVRIEIDPVAEWRQMFEETARLMADHYFVEDMSGVDWWGAVERYRPLLERITTRDDLSEVIWELQGELATSHAYEVPPRRLDRESAPIGQLGADFAVRDGELVLERLLPAESSVSAARSPLGAPGVALEEGDVLVAIDGRRVDAARGAAPLLVGAADRPVELSVRKPGQPELRRVVVVPLGDERPLRYQDWVARTRAAVHERSADRVGYLHVPDMVATGWAELHRDLRVEVRYPALVVDVRDNRGGHVSELVVEKLARTVRGWELGRHRGPTTYPRDARRGPIVLVADEHAGSDGDIVTAAFKLYGLGPVVGTRTWGGVVGIDYAYQLVDGTTVTQPRYAFYFSGGLGFDIENFGVAPDVEVLFGPSDWAQGRDPQLDAAVELALRALEAQPPASPPEISLRPSRAPRPLPPRP